MTRLIDADALILQMESDANQMEDPIAIMFTYAAINDIKHAPTVNAEPVRHGQWDYVTVVDEGFWRCSICGTPSEAIGANKLYKYCPFCGARMDDGREE